MIPKIFETTRFTIILIGYFICYWLAGKQPILMLHYFMPCVVLSLSGLTGIEGTFFSKYTAGSLGRKISPYQIQSGMNNLAVGITGLIVYLSNWGRYADAAVMIATLLFITLSACMHTYEAIKLGNKSRKNMMRGVWTLALLLLCLPILIQGLAA